MVFNRPRRAVGFDRAEGSLAEGSPMRSNPTARRGRNYLEFFKIFNEHRDGTVHTLDGTELGKYHPL